jgi:protein-S-isoprenylcysteine O-methyltransferase Ste14
VLKHIRAIALLPVMATVIIPGILLAATHSANIGWSLPGPVNWLACGVGIALIGLGFILVVNTVSLFASQGRGTLAPWDPTQKLVVHGVYRYVRNPMISGVLGILLGEVICLGSIPLLYWFILFLMINLIYIPLVEEPGLERRFGEAYAHYRRNVPRWIPRLKPWTFPSQDEADHLR